MNTNFQTIHQMGSAISDFVKQATGRDNVQNIDIDHVTVAQNHVYEEVDISGQAVRFNAGAAGLPFEKLLVQIEPVQDLHGYDHPWPAGGGKNKFKNYGISGTYNDMVYTVQDDGTININGTSSGSNIFTISKKESTSPLSAYCRLSDLGIEADKTYILNGCPPASQSTYSLQLLVYGSGQEPKDIGSGSAPFSFTADDIDNKWYRLGIRVANGAHVNNLVFKPMIRLASETDGTFEPYSNICPITGWTMVNLYQAGQNLENARVFRFTFPTEAGTVYGGTLDVTTGTLVVDRAYINLGTLNYHKYTVDQGPLFRTAITGIKRLATGSDVPNILCSQYETKSNATRSDKSVSQQANSIEIDIIDSSYSDSATFKEAMSGVQLVYELATPITYQLTTQEVSTLLGRNNIWADTGDIEVKFTNLKELY